MKKNILNRNIAFYICLGVSLFLMIGGAITPPPFIIDGSMFKAVGWLFAFAALSQLPDIIHNGKNAKITHNNTTIEISTPEEEEQKQDEDITLS